MMLGAGKQSTSGVVLDLCPHHPFSPWPPSSCPSLPVEARRRVGVARRVVVQHRDKLPRDDRRELGRCGGKSGRRMGAGRNGCE